jgi:predicted membrane protein
MMLWTILVILLVLWALGLLGSVGGSLIHALLVVALILFIVQMFSGRRRAI